MKEMGFMHYSIEDKGKYKMIHIIGNLTPEISTKVLDDTISCIIEEGTHHFVFNLEKTNYLDSSGIGIFIHCLCDVQQNQGSIYIIAQENQVREVLQMVGIDRLIKIYPSEADFYDDKLVAVN